MIIKIAWQNIWRSKLRSFVVITAIALGLLAGIFASAFVNGMMHQRIDNVIEKETAHFQIHANNYREEYDHTLYMEHTHEITSTLSQDTAVKGYAERVISMVMIASANHSGAVKVVGVNPEQEATVTGLDKHVVEGKYFEGIKRNPILVSQKIAEKYRIKLRSKVVLTFQDIHGEMTASSYRVAGIYDTKNGLYDQMHVFVKKDNLSPDLKLPEGALHEISVMLDRHEIAEPYSKIYQEKYPDLEVLSWLDLGLGMRYMVEAMGSYTHIFVGIILIALLFSIVNTMLMSVLERTREFGMLMAIGMSKGKVFMMILWETLFLSLIGGPLGMLLSLVSISYFGHEGIDLSAANYEDMGFSNIIYPYLDLKSYLEVGLMVMAMSLLAALYPARKALGLNPVEAIRKI